jgi:hypothetical protein
MGLPCTSTQIFDFIVGVLAFWYRYRVQLELNSILHTDPADFSLTFKKISWPCRMLLRSCFADKSVLRVRVKPSEDSDFSRKSWIQVCFILSHSQNRVESAAESEVCRLRN